MSNVSEVSSTAITFWDDDNEHNATWRPILTTGSTSSKRPIYGILLPAFFTGLIIIANVVSLAAFYVEKRLRTYNNYFIINLSILDLSLGIGMILSVVHTHLGYYPLPQAACKVISGILYGVLNASNLTVVVICIDRHMATYDPINHFVSRSKRKAIILNMVPWVLGLTFWMFYTTIWEFVEDFDNGIHCVRLYQQSAFTFMVQNGVIFYLPFIIVTILYLKIYVKIRATLRGRCVKSDMKGGPSRAPQRKMEGILQDMPSSIQPANVVSYEVESTNDNDPTTSEEKSIESEETKSTSGKRRESAVEMRKATYTLLLIIVAFVLAWSPYSIISLLYSINPSLIFPALPRPVYIFLSYLTIGNSLLNPISYAVSQPLFRATVINMLFCMRK